MSQESDDFRRALAVGALWLFPGGAVLGLVLSAIYGAHGTAFLFVGGGLFGLIGATVHAMLSVMPPFERAASWRRIVAVFAGTLVISVPLWLAFGLPSAKDFALVALVVLGLSALIVRLSRLIEGRTRRS
jgi:hypothetical protein